MPPISLRRIVRPWAHDRTADSPVATTLIAGRRQDRFHAGIHDDSSAFPAQRAFHRRELLPPTPGTNPMPPRRESTLRGARDDPKAWPPSSAPLRLDVPAPRPRLLGVAPPEPRPPFIRMRERVSNFFGPWRSPNLSQRCCVTSAWLFDFCNRLSCDARALFPWARSSREKGDCPSCVAAPGCAFAPAAFPLCGGRAAPCAAASHVHLSDARPCDRTLSAEHGDPLPANAGQRHERDVGRRESRPWTKHVHGLPPIRAPRETCVGRVPARTPTEHLLSPTEGASRDGSRSFELCRPRLASCHLPAKGGGVGQPRCFPPSGTG